MSLRDPDAFRVRATREINPVSLRQSPFSWPKGDPNLLRPEILGLAERQVGDPVSQFFGIAADQEQLQVVGQAAEADTPLGGEEDAGEGPALLLPLGGDPQEVLVL